MSVPAMVSRTAASCFMKDRRLGIVFNSFSFPLTLHVANHWVSWLGFRNVFPFFPTTHPCLSTIYRLIAHGRFLLKLPTLPSLFILIIVMLRCHLQYNKPPNFLCMSFWPRSQHPFPYYTSSPPSILDTSLAFWSPLPQSTTQVMGEESALCAILPRALEKRGLRTLGVQGSRIQKYDRINSSGLESCSQERHHEKKFGLSIRPGHMTHT